VTLPVGTGRYQEGQKRGVGVCNILGTNSDGKPLFDVWNTPLLVQNLVADLLARDPLPGADQRVPGTFPGIGQVHRVDAVRDPARAAQLLPLDARRGSALLFLPRLIQDPGPHPARTAVPAGGIVQPGDPFMPASAAPQVRPSSAAAVLAPFIRR